MIGIYKITNKIDGKVYIGQSNDIERRIREHKRTRTETIDDYINVLGVENFDFEILEECSLDNLDSKEQEYVEKYNSRQEGYNIQKGGYNNSKGEGNGRARLTENDVIFIRESYAKHSQPNEIYKQYFQDKITKSQFQAVWQGRSWCNIMPEVYTLENKEYYTAGQMRQRAILTPQEVFQYRKDYINLTRKDLYNKMCEEKGPILKATTFYKILIGDVRKDSIYNSVPVYRKSQQKWYLNGKPVSTIPETWE